ncbi:MAG: HPF/RaiA family ribosome-associated protein [Candidatus Dormibacteraeota bacterium]|nr:HPF/RaiA family ribosome-associated protein [Candidatus Dormibacteraeota bacterium]MBV9526308.1 HPF/RaiA family ribosome-associated protein [Candidatus Dormibacteraeota bacterium]
MAQAGPRRGLRGGADMRVSITARTPDPAQVRAYAEVRLARLQRHSRLYDVSVVVEADPKHQPVCSAEVVVHLHHHVRLVATAAAATAQEAIDAAVGRADRQVLRRKDRVTERKGHLGADGVGPAPA